MAKRIFILFIFCCSAVFADPAPGFDNHVNFEISIKELYSHAKNGSLDSIKSKYFILDGSFSAYNVIDNKEPTYTVEIELINGEWKGVSNVVMYKAIVIFSGKEYQAKFPERRRSTPDPAEVPINSGLIVVAKLKGTKNIDGEVIPVLDGYYLRVYK
ncbi:MAG: hypothetical protein FWF38_02790 [Spirochaetaceae bacterium]|nr:hypothetical protein [Spirochaetaceae bacterium]